MADKIANDATLRDLTGTLEQQKDYIQKLLSNFIAHADFVVRIGVQGKGCFPNYRFEPIQSESSQEHKVSFRGQNHEKLELEHMIEDNWSSRTMTFVDAASHFESIIKALKRK